MSFAPMRSGIASENSFTSRRKVCGRSSAPGVVSGLRSHDPHAEAMLSEMKRYEGRVRSAVVQHEKHIIKLHTTRKGIEASMKGPEDAL